MLDSTQLYANAEIREIAAMDRVDRYVAANRSAADIAAARDALTAATNTRVTLGRIVAQGR